MISTVSKDLIVVFTRRLGVFTTFENESSEI